MGGCDSSCNRRRPRRKARSSAAGDRAATGRARRAEERRQGAHGNAASGGAYHRGDEGGRGGLATPCSAPVLVLEPGDVGLGNRKATAIGRRRAASPTPLTGNEQHHERAGGNAYGPLSARLDLKVPAVPRPDTDHTGPSIPPASMPMARSRGLPRAGGSGLLS